MKSIARFCCAVLIGSGTTAALATTVTQSVSTTQNVTPPAIALVVNHALAFPDAVQGSGALTLPPTDPNAANISITNGDGRAVTTSIVESSINLSDGASDTIAVSTWVASPALGAVTLPATGNQVVTIGATRAALTTQPAAAYSGVFTFKVVY